MTDSINKDPPTKKQATGLIFKTHTGMVGWTDARLAEVGFHRAMGYFLKIDGTNNKTGKTEQVQIWIDEQDTADLIALLIKLIRANGKGPAETLERFLELRS